MNKAAKKRIAALTREDMEHTMRELALAAAKMDELQGKLNEELAIARQRYEPELAALRASYDEHEELALEWARQHPEEFATRKSVALVHGVIGFRTGNPALKPLAGLTWEAVLNALRAAFPAYVRVKAEVDKAGLLAARQEIGDGRLQSVGLHVVQAEEPYVEPKKESVLQAS